jgi:hypothetical protein
MAGNPEEVEEARQMVRDEKLYISDIARVARERQDAAIFPALLRNILRFYDNDSDDLQQLWEEIRTNQPQELATAMLEMLEMLAEVPDVKQAKPVLQMLDKMDKADRLFGHSFDVLVRCAESPVPQVARFAFEHLTPIEEGSHDWATLCEQAGEKLWSDNGGLAKDAAKFLGVAGARHEAAASIAWSALGDALSLNAVPLLELLLRSLGQIKAKQAVEVDDALRARLLELKAENAAKLGKLCDRLL